MFPSRASCTPPSEDTVGNGVERESGSCGDCFIVSWIVLNSTVNAQDEGVGSICHLSL